MVDTRSEPRGSCAKCGSRLAVEGAEYCLYCLDLMIYERKQAGTQLNLDKWC